MMQSKWMLTCVVTLCGCTVVGMNEVPVVDRSTPARGAGAAVVRATSPAAAPTPAVSRGGASASGVSGGSAIVDTPVVMGSSLEARPLDVAPLPAVESAKEGSTKEGSTKETAKETTMPAAAAPMPLTPSAPAAGATWAWPTQGQGKLLELFVEGRNKGIDIAGKEGDPVLAAQDGQVIYSGNSLKGLGNLVILKHSDDFVSAYGHNKQNFVEKGQSIKRGERIAELGSTEATSPRLHFEIRRQGKPVDPLKYLPPR